MTVKGKNKIGAVVIGAGNIGTQLDVAGSHYPLNHAAGYMANSLFELIGIADTSERALKLASNWQCPKYSDVRNMMHDLRPLVVSICVPTSQFTAIHQILLEFPIALCISEKPFTNSFESAVAFSKMYEGAQSSVIVNFTRRFIPQYQKLSDLILETGGAISATIRYAKGILHNGIHAIDLARLLFGDVLSATALSSQFDYWEDDPTMTAHLSLEQCPNLILQGLDEGCFTFFELDVITRQARFIIDQDGTRLRIGRVHSNVGVPPGNRLVMEKEENIKSNSAITNLMENAAGIIQGNASPICSVNEAIEAQRIISQLTQQLPGAPIAAG